MYDVSQYARERVCAWCARVVSALKCILVTLVEDDEWGKMYKTFGLSAPTSGVDPTAS